MVHRKKQSKLVYLFGSLAIFSVCLGIAIYNYQPKNNLIKATTATIITTIAPEQKPAKTLSAKYLFLGTIFWGRGIENWSKTSSGAYNYNWALSGLNSFDRASYNEWLADLECPITNANLSFSAQIETLIFNCRPEFLPSYAKYFSILNLANNHSDNRGSSGLQNTRAELAKNNIQTVGHYDPSLVDDICEVTAMQVNLSDGTKGSMPVALCAWHYFYRKPLPGEIEQITKYSKIMPTIGLVHMGAEYLATATPIQQEIARSIVDAGADFVVANNPHWIQNAESYKGRLIMYSTGNFIFDQLDYETQRSVSLAVSIKSEVNDNIQKMLEVGTSCKVYKDDCYTKLIAAKVTKPNLNYSFAPIGGDQSGRTPPKLSSPVHQDDIEKRLNWANVLKDLKY
jgi:hypothetical protein